MRVREWVQPIAIGILVAFVAPCVGLGALLSVMGDPAPERFTVDFHNSTQEAIAVDWSNEKPVLLNEVDTWCRIGPHAVESCNVFEKESRKPSVRYFLIVKSRAFPNRPSAVAEVSPAKLGELERTRRPVRIAQSPCGSLRIEVP
jgi:hypothetical protein